MDILENFQKIEVGIIQMIRKVMQKFLPGLSSHTFFFIGHATQHELRDGLRFVTKGGKLSLGDQEGRNMEWI